MTHWSVFSFCFIFVFVCFPTSFLPHIITQVWFQNARAKLRRSLNSDDPQISSPSAPFTMVTSSSPPACSKLDQSQPFLTSTIDQLQLSMLTAPIVEQPVSPAINQPSHQHLQSSAFYLDFDSQGASGCMSSLEPQRDFVEEEKEDDQNTFRLQYC